MGKILYFHHPPTRHLTPQTAKLSTQTTTLAKNRIEVIVQSKDLKSRYWMWDKVEWQSMSKMPLNKRQFNEHRINLKALKEFGFFFVYVFFLDFTASCHQLATQDCRDFQDTALFIWSVVWWHHCFYSKFYVGQKTGKKNQKKRNKLLIVNYTRFSTHI